MIEDDVQLIHRILSGDEEAFTALVRKYQKSVHALAWRKIGDFHHAEEITQDTFLQVYKKLSTLKDHRQFSGWLYVITSRQCLNWLRKKKSTIQSLETISMKTMNKAAYSQYEMEQREAESTEHLQNAVKKLLNKLPESERTVMTLYYLGEMTTREVSKFLGVSINTVTSRLHRARQRLQQDEEILIQETFRSVQLSPNLPESITQKVTNIKPTAQPTGKPILPWVALGAATVLFLVILGASDQYLARFQRPYNFKAQSEPTIEIIETSIVLEIDAKPAIRNQMGRAITTPKNSTAGAQGTQTPSKSNASIESPTLSASQWVQSTGPQSGLVYDIFATTNGALYAFSPTGIYRLLPDEQTWALINTRIPIEGFRVPMAEHRNTLYLVSKDAVFTSTDSGETWRILCTRPKGYPIGLIVSDTSQPTDLQTGFTMYLAIRQKGIFRSTNNGKQWVPLNNGITEKNILTLTAIGNTVFAGTNDGLYRLNEDLWQQSLVNTLKTTQSFENKAFPDRMGGLYVRNSGIWEQISTENVNATYALTTSGNNLYAAIGIDLFGPKSSEPKEDVLFIVGDPKPAWVFRSTDFGESWTEITPKGQMPFFAVFNGVKMLAAGNTLFVQGVEVFRSTDSGETWTNLGMIDPNLIQQGGFQSVAVNEQTFYLPGNLGIYRTTDAGNSWHTFVDGMIGTGTQRLITYNNQLYAHTNLGILQSNDAGESWQSVQIGGDNQTGAPGKKKQPHADFSSDSRLIVADGALYGIAPVADNLQIFRLSTDGKVFTQFQGVPTLDGHSPSPETVTAIAKAERLQLADEMEKDKRLTKLLESIAVHVKAGGFAVSDGTFYVEYQRQLFKWKHGDPEWTNTGLIDLGERLSGGARNEFKLAVSGKTVYVGKRDGKLFQSLDSGNSWRDITPNLPQTFTRFNEIVFAGSTVFVATDTGILVSETGASWRVITDKVAIDRFAVDDETVYGAGDTGVYRSDTRGKWEQISQSVPGKVRSLVVDGNKLYIVTQHQGIFHISLKEKDHNLSHNSRY